VYFAAYQLGLTMLGQSTPDMPAWNWESLDEVLRTLWKPLFLGCGAMALICSVIGYFAVNALWRYSVLRKRQLRKDQKTPTSSPR